MIRAQEVLKFYGAKRALGPVSFEIADGETVGFLGLNGAGKTTALRIFACDLRPSAGSIQVGDIDAVKHPHEVRKRVGYLPENPPLYMDMPVDEYLTYAGRLRQMDRGEVRKRLPEVLEATDLGDVKTERIGTLSHGYRQRVGMAQAIIHKPMLLILDEPTRGLDPVQIVEMRNLIRNLRGEHTVLVSSHILTEISETCDRLLVLGKGEVLGSGSEKELSSSIASSHRSIVMVRPSEGRGESELVELVEKISDVDSVKMEPAGEAMRIVVQSSSEVRPELCRALVEAGHDVLELRRDQRELESIFLKLVQGGTSDARN